MRWNEQFDGTKESLLDKSHRPHSQPPSMVKMNGYAAIDSVRLLRSWADKAAVAADFHLRKGHLLLWGMTNGKHSKCMYTLRFWAKIRFVC